MPTPVIEPAVAQAVAVLKKGGIIAYPTEYCFGLGCDPNNPSAIERLLKIKRRSTRRGLILIAGNIAQIENYADLKSSPLRSAIEESWPGPHTWLLPATDNVSIRIRGEHKTVAMRLTGHSVARQICTDFGGAIVSTSANRHGEPVLMSSQAVDLDMGSEIDFIVDAPLGGASAPSKIRDGISGERIR